MVTLAVPFLVTSNINVKKRGRTEGGGGIAMQQAAHAGRQGRKAGRGRAGRRAARQSDKQAGARAHSQCNPTERSARECCRGRIGFDVSLTNVDHVTD